MKKIYFLTAISFATSFLSAQTTETFESFSLTPESYDNGSAGNGDFVFNPLTLDNVYNDAWSSWTGFSISNVTDNTTPGSLNQYASFTGAGYESVNYAVFYYEGGMQVNNEAKIDSFKITNTTYAAISMRDGDTYAKQFGSVNGYDGQPDGTNGEDYFRVWVIAEDATVSNKDSIEVYLADYRFADNNEDYILDEWMNIDLTSFAFDVNKVSFRMESSDNGAWGMNTPAYFAIDDVVCTNSLAISEAEELNVSCYPSPFNNSLLINGLNGVVLITDSKGMVVYSSQINESLNLETSTWENGVYFVKMETSKGSKTIKMVK